ncbi:MAG: hypothetical protein HY013_21145 [Candidatus Solibacter usitatus]|nr:hypothetical protein [Candidatus Solibacter usitatus]
MQLSFGDQTGADSFLRNWEPDSSSTKLWSTLESVLLLGGSFDTLEGRRIFCAPYIYSRFSPDISGVFEHAVIVGKGVKLRSGPSMSAAVLAELAYDILEIEPDGQASGSNPWVKGSSRWQRGLRCRGNRAPASGLQGLL